MWRLGGEVVATGATRSLAAAQQARYIGFLHRYPFTLDAYDRGFAVGVREDYRYGSEQYTSLDLPVIILDNAFEDPDRDRYMERFDQYDPAVAIVGDAATADEAATVAAVATDLTAEHPYKTVVAVPKCDAALDRFVQLDDVVLGYPMGYAAVQAADFCDLREWRGQDVHLLGGNPHEQYQVIQQLTQPTLDDAPPANIVGLDGNGLQKGAYKGEYWTPDGWQPADELSIRETVQRSLDEVKTFWQNRGVWPTTEPCDIYGAVRQSPEPGDPVSAVTGADLPDSVTDPDALVVEYEEYVEYGPVAFASRAEQQFFESREDVTPVLDGTPRNPSR